VVNSIGLWSSVSLLQNSQKFVERLLLMLFDEPLLDSLQGTMATIDPYSVKREAIEEYRMDLIEERLSKIENQIESIVKKLS
jgi:hypothetical protein